MAVKQRWNPNTKRMEAIPEGGADVEEAHTSKLEEEKFNPALRGKSMSQEEVEATGGLGALAAKRRRKKPMGPTTDDAAAALTKRKEANP